MNSTIEQIGEMSIEFIAMMRIAEDREVGSKSAATEAIGIVNQINDLCMEVPLSEIKFMEQRLRKITMWIANGPVAQA
jgi:hypothetical protein